MKCQDPEFQLPLEVSNFLLGLMKYKKPKAVLDPQAGEGGLLKAFTDWGTRRFGIDVAAKYKYNPEVTMVSATTVNAFEIVKELEPTFTKRNGGRPLHWDVMVAYPPARNTWVVRDIYTGQPAPTKQVKERAALVTLKLGLHYANSGYVVVDSKEIDELGLDKIPGVYKRTPIPHVNNELEALFFERPNPIDTKDNQHQLADFWCKLRDIVDAGPVPQYQISSYANTSIKVDIHPKHKFLGGFSLTEEMDVNNLRHNYPDTMAIDKIDRDKLKLALKHIKAGKFTADPNTVTAIKSAIREAVNLATPVMPPTDFEKIAYVENGTKIKCHTTGLGFTAGREYKVEEKKFQFEFEFTRNKVHFDSKQQETYMKEHDCKLIGQDRMLTVKNDNFQIHRFMDRPPKGNPFDHQEMEIWDYFEQPQVLDLAQRNPDKYRKNLAILENHAAISGFSYLPGQLDYLARVAIRDHGLPAAQTGTGKTLFALSLASMKSAKRALILAPQGTTRGGSGVGELAQWREEIAKFAPYFDVHEIFRWKDVEDLQKANKGKLPEGIYLTYYEAFFYAGTTHPGRAVMDRGENMKDDTIYPYVYPPKQPGHDPDELTAASGNAEWVKGLGQEQDQTGIRCLATPNMSILIGDQFDMVVMDEAHKIANVNSNITRLALRLQPRYRYCLTATPIKNHVGDLFPLMGWLNCKDWYKGGRSSAGWPFPKDQASKFVNTYLSKERDVTAERDRKRADPTWKGTCVKTSPILSRPTSLLRMVKNCLAYIDKPMCNPAYVPPDVRDIRVPFGVGQAKLYAHYMDRANIASTSAMVKAAVQGSYLRNICCDPATCEQNGDGTDRTPFVKSNFNPKLISTLEVTTEILAAREQVVIVSARQGFNNELAKRLEEARIPYGRIDSTIPTRSHSREANDFKQGKTRVLLMGIKCAEGHSFDNCRNLIITSLEYSYGSFDQALGRVDRLMSKGAIIRCILHKASIEEIMFDTVATKGESSDICLKGKRVPRMWKPADISEILAESITAFNDAATEDEGACEEKWEILKTKMEMVL